MEIDTIFYKAKDGKIFTDPLECEEYEKTIGILPGSVGSLICDLEKMGPDTYICGIVHIRRKDGTKLTYSRFTMCIDGMLESFVNVGDLTEKKRYIISTAEELALTLKEENKDDPAQCMIIFSKDINMKNVSLIAINNPSVWDKIDK